MNCLRPVKVVNPLYNSLLEDVKMFEKNKSYFDSKLNSLRFTTTKGKERVATRIKYISLMRDLAKTESVINWRAFLLELQPPHFVVPCRKCLNCLKKRAWEWRGRLIREFQICEAKGQKVGFITLTYDNDNIKNAPETYSKDIAQFFDGLRSYFRRSIRHFCIAERGEEKGRFHIHCLLFDCPEELLVISKRRISWKERIRKSKNNIPHGDNVILQRYWQRGYSDIGESTVKGATYVSTYITKEKPDKNGDYFKGAIYASNGLGTRLTDKQLIDVSARVKSGIECGKYPSYKLGNFTFPYPASLFNKLVPAEGKYLLRLQTQAKVAERGMFRLKKSEYFDSYDSYMNALKIYYRDVFPIKTKAEEFVEYNNSLKRWLDFLASDNYNEFNEWLQQCRFADTDKYFLPAVVANYDDVVPF